MINHNMSVKFLAYIASKKVLSHITLTAISSLLLWEQVESTVNFSLDLINTAHIPTVLGR